MTSVPYTSMLFVIQAILQNDQWDIVNWSTHEQLERHWGIFSSVAADALMLKHQAISIHIPG